MGARFHGRRGRSRLQGRPGAGEGLAGPRECGPDRAVVSCALPRKPRCLPDDAKGRQQAEAKAPQGGRPQQKATFPVPGARETTASAARRTGRPGPRAPPPARPSGAHRRLLLALEAACLSPPRRLSEPSSGPGGPPAALLSPQHARTEPALGAAQAGQRAAVSGRPAADPVSTDRGLQPLS
nr:unnamed protein product [Rangifer tarandus platyrhynchus]